MANFPSFVRRSTGSCCRTRSSKRLQFSASPYVRLHKLIRACAKHANSPTTSTTKTRHQEVVAHDQLLSLRQRAMLAQHPHSLIQHQHENLMSLRVSISDVSAGFLPSLRLTTEQYKVDERDLFCLSDVLRSFPFSNQGNVNRVSCHCDAQVDKTPAQDTASHYERHLWSKTGMLSRCGTLHTTVHGHFAKRADIPVASLSAIFTWTIPVWGQRRPVCMRTMAIALLGNLLVTPSHPCVFKDFSHAGILERTDARKT